MSSGYKMDTGEGYKHSNDEEANFWSCESPGGQILWYVQNEGLDRNCSNIYMAGMSKGFDQGYAKAKEEIRQALNNTESPNKFLNPEYYRSK